MSSNNQALKKEWEVLPESAYILMVCLWAVPLQKIFGQHQAWYRHVKLDKWACDMSKKFAPLVGLCSQVCSHFFVENLTIEKLLSPFYHLHSLYIYRYTIHSLSVVYHVPDWDPLFTIGYGPHPHINKISQQTKLVLRKLSWLGHMTAELEISEDQLGLGSASGSRHIGPAEMPAQGRIFIRYIGAGSEPGPSQPKTGSSFTSSIL